MIRHGTRILSASILGTTVLTGCELFSPAADVVGEEVAYTAADGTTCRGYLAYDRSQEGERPGVLVVHEWWGHNDYVRDRARQLAAMGYTALALDMYGDGKNTGHPAEAGEFMNAALANMNAGVQRFDAARELLESHSTTDASRTAAIGYCFGGGVLLHLARNGADLRGVASFHGSLGAQARTTPEQVHTQVLLCHGDDDQFAKAEDLAATLEEFGETLELHVYEGAPHGFTNPAATAKGAEFGIPIGYDAAADAQSWLALTTFLARVLR